MDLLSSAQVAIMRQALQNISDTFAFPVVLTRTTYTHGAFASDPIVEEFNLTAIRDFKSEDAHRDQFRNAMGPQAAHEMNLFILWQNLEAENLVDSENKALIDHNDLVKMEGEIYEIQAFEGVGEITKKPSFLQMRVRRRWADVNGANSP